MLSIRSIHSLKLFLGSRNVQNLVSQCLCNLDNIITGLIRVTGLYFTLGAFQVNLKGNLQIYRFDIHRQSFIDFPVNDIMYPFSIVIIRKTLTQVFFYDVISITMVSMTGSNYLFLIHCEIGLKIIFYKDKTNRCN